MTAYTFLHFIFIDVKHIYLSTCYYFISDYINIQKELLGHNLSTDEVKGHTDSDTDPIHIRSLQWCSLLYHAIIPSSSSFGILWYRIVYGIVLYRIISGMVLYCCIVSCMVSYYIVSYPIWYRIVLLYRIWYRIISYMVSYCIVSYCVWYRIISYHIVYGIVLYCCIMYGIVVKISQGEWSKTYNKKNFECQVSIVVGWYFHIPNKTLVANRISQCR